MMTMTIIGLCLIPNYVDIVHTQHAQPAGEQFASRFKFAHTPVCKLSCTLTDVCTMHILASAENHTGLEEVCGMLNAAVAGANASLPM